MIDPSSSLTPPRKSSWAREGIAVAVSLIGAGASLNNWLPAFQIIGGLLILVGIVVLAAAAWRLLQPEIVQRLPSRARQVAAGGALTALVATLVLGSRMAPLDPGFLTMEAPVAPATTLTGVSILDLLPDQYEIPADLVEVETGKRGGEALARLLEWGFVENAYRNFTRPPGAAPDPRTIYLMEISLFRLGSADGASAALQWFTADRLALSKLEVAPIASIGDESTAIAGEQETETGGTSYREATVYARKGNVVARVTARSTLANPMPAAIEITQFFVQLATPRS